MMKRFIPLGVLSVCVITGITYVLYSQLKKNLLEKAEIKLTTALTTVVSHIDRMLEQQKQSLQCLAQVPEIKTLLKNKPNTLPARIPAHLVKKYLEHEYYESLVLINHERTIIASYTRDTQATVPSRRLIYKLYALLHERKLPIVLSDLEYTTTGELALILGIPIVNNNQLEGALLAKLDYQKFISIFSHEALAGTTAEIIAAQCLENSLVFTTNVRYRPQIAAYTSDRTSQEVSTMGEQQPVQGQRVPTLLEQSQVLVKAVHGQDSAGVTLDYRFEPVIAVGRFSKLLTWGIVAKQDVTEVMQPLYGLKVALYFLVALTVLLVLYSVLDILVMYYTAVRNPLLSVLWTVLVITLVVFMYTFYSYSTLKKQTFDYAKKESRNKLIYTAQLITQELAYNTHVAEEFVRTLGYNHSTVRCQDIVKHMKRMLENNPHLIALALAVPKQDRAFGSPYVVKVKDTNAAYEFNKVVKNAYALFKQQHAHWVAPFKEPITGENTLVYALPITVQQEDKHIQATLVCMFSITSIQKGVRELNLDKIGYSVLVNHANTVLYHPIASYSQEQKTVAQVLEETDSPALEKLKQVQEHRQEDTTSFPWILYHTFPSLNWTLAFIVPEQDVAALLPAKKLNNYQVYLLAASVIAVALILTLLVVIYKNIALLAYSRVLSGILLVGLIVAWVLLDRASVSTYTYSAHYAITDQLALNKFLDQLRYSQDIHELTTISTGIFIESLSINDENRLAWSGYVWQTYPLTYDKKNIKAPLFVQAHNVDIRELYRKTHDNQETVGWSVKAELPQISEGIQYPFDRRHITITLMHPDLLKYIVLVPDLLAYKDLSPTALPGVASQVNLVGFESKRSFFSLTMQEKNTTFGYTGTAVADYEYPQLTFTILLKRKLFNAFVDHVLPLIIIIIALFGVLLLAEYMSKKEALTASGRVGSLSIYIALFFSLVLVHRSLRSELMAGTVLYIEYFFFYTYLTLLAMLIYTIVRPIDRRITLWQRRAPFMQFLYWPIQLSLWLVTTLIILYRY